MVQVQNLDESSETKQSACFCFDSAHFVSVFKRSPKSALDQAVSKFFKTKSPWQCNCLLA